MNTPFAYVRVVVYGCNSRVHSKDTKRVRLKSMKKCNGRISFLINYKMYGKSLTLKLQLDIIQLRKKERVD